jgi:hypothetical protein
LCQETVEGSYNAVAEETGLRYNRADLTAPGVRNGPSGAEWRGVNPAHEGRHWAIHGFVEELVAAKNAVEALDGRMIVCASHS